MPEDDIIHFAIIALNKDQVNEVILKLKEEEMYELSSWLEKNKDEIYGKGADEWKPFKGETLASIICKNSRCYESETSLIERLAPNLKVTILKRIKVFYIDAFSIYLDQYRNISTKGDWYFCAVKNCFILLSPELPDEGRKYLESKFHEFWPSFNECCKSGAYLRISGREEDINNFTNQVEDLIHYEDNRPNHVTEKAANDFLRNKGRRLPIN